MTYPENSWIKPGADVYVTTTDRSRNLLVRATVKRVAEKSFTVTSDSYLDDERFDLAEMKGRRIRGSVYRNIVLRSDDPLVAEIKTRRRLTVLRASAEEACEKWQRELRQENPPRELAALDEAITALTARRDALIAHNTAT
jgi:hypothetical protein